MRIVNLVTFLKSPAGTVYCKYNANNFGPMEIFCGADDVAKDNGFIYKPLFEPTRDVSGSFDDVLTKAEKTGDSIPIVFDAISHTNGFKETQLFAVFDKGDVEGLVSVLTESLWLTAKNKR